MKAPPPMEFDGKLFWYTKYFDPTDDRCCLCKRLIPDEETPLVLFKREGKRTWQARLHMEPCGQQLLAMGYLKRTT